MSCGSELRGLPQQHNGSEYAPARSHGSAPGARRAVGARAKDAGRSIAAEQSLATSYSGRPEPLAVHEADI